MRFLHLFVCVLILLPGAAWSASTNHLLNTNWATSSTQNGFDTARSVDGVAYPRAGSGIGCLSGEDPNCTRGWALYQNGSNTYQDASGVFESLTNLTDSELTMVLSFRYHVRFLFGSFQVQVTNDDRANFANNVANGGQLGSSAARQLGSSAARQLGSSWTTVSPTSVSFVDYNGAGPIEGGSSLYVDATRSNLPNGELFIAAQGATYPMTSAAGYPNGADYRLSSSITRSRAA